MDIKKPQLVKVGAFAYFFEGVLQHPRCAGNSFRNSAVFVILQCKNVSNSKQYND